MKILHISKFYPPEPGGIENFVYDLANAQVRQGHDVTVLCHQADEAAPTLTETIHGATIVRVKTLGQLAYAPVTPAFLLHLHRTIRRFQPDVIHAHLPNVSAFWLLFLPQNMSPDPALARGCGGIKNRPENVFALSILQTVGNGPAQNSRSYYLHLRHLSEKQHAAKAMAKKMPDSAPWA